MLKPEHNHEIPEETREVAEAAFPKGRMRPTVKKKKTKSITQ